MLDYVGRDLSTNGEMENQIVSTSMAGSKRTFFELSRDEQDQIADLFPLNDQLIYFEDLVKKKEREEAERRLKRFQWQLDHIQEYMRSLIDYCDVQLGVDKDFRVQLTEPLYRKVKSERDEVLYKILHNKGTRVLL